MSIIRSKMACGNISHGQQGISAEFSAVYEGSPELQAISENAIYGDATPSGSMTLTGGGLDALVKDEEYFVELHDADPGALKGEIMRAIVTKIYQSAERPEQYKPVQFRFNAAAGQQHVSLYQSIANPEAVAMMANDVVLMIVREAGHGRRSDREIELRQKMLDDAREYVAKETNRRPHTDVWIAGLERKLARAKGLPAIIG